MVRSLYLADSDWDMRVYTLVDDATPIGTCDPCHALVRHFPTAPLEKHRFRKKRVARPKPVTDDPVLEALEDLNGDGDGSHHSDSDNDGGSSDGGKSSGDGDGNTTDEEGKKVVVAPPTPPDIAPRSPSPVPSHNSPSVDLFFSEAGSSSSSDSDSSDSDGGAKEHVGMVLR